MKDIKLETGMIVELKNGFKGLFFGLMIIGKMKEENKFSSIMIKDMDIVDIKAIYKIKGVSVCNNIDEIFESDKLELVWNNDIDNYQYLRDVLLKKNIGRKFKFVLNGRELNGIQTIVKVNGMGISYITENNIVLDIKQILEQDIFYKYKIKFVE